MWRRLRDLFEVSLLTAIFVGPASYIFISSLFADLAQNHVANEASLRVTLQFAQEEELEPIFSPLLYGHDLFNFSSCNFSS